MNTPRIAVWDVPVRLFHWIFASSFLGAYLTSESERWRDVHLIAGYTLAAMLLFRVLWGFIGSRYARFTEFWPTPSGLKSYLGSLFSRRPQHFVGHNPAGAVAIFALLSLGGLTAASGWINYAEFGGPTIAHWMEEIHEGLANAMLVIVGIHLAGVVVSSWLHRENLVRAMITGSK
jgi:cytochrome b